MAACEGKREGNSGICMMKVMKCKKCGNLGCLGLDMKVTCTKQGFVAKKCLRCGTVGQIEEFK